MLFPSSAFLKEQQLTFCGLDGHER